MQHAQTDLSPAHRIASVALDDASILRRSAEIEHEREIAMRDLVAVGAITPASGLSGPFALQLSLREQRLGFALTSDAGSETITLPLAPFRSVIKDYFLMCDSYYAALAHEGAHRIQTLDMARRATHNEGAELLTREMGRKAALDKATARALFTLICVLHLR